MTTYGDQRRHVVRAHRGGTTDTDNNTPDFAAADAEQPAEQRAARPGRPGAVGRRLRPGQRRRQRRPQREPARHVQRAGDGRRRRVLAHVRQRDRARRHAREPHRLRARPGDDAARGHVVHAARRGRQLPRRGHRTTRRTRARTTARRSARPRSPACASTTSRAPRTSRPTATGSSRASPASSPRRRFNGFYIQDPQPDRDVRTSEGIFIFTGTGLTPAGGRRGRRRGDRRPAA